MADAIGRLIGAAARGLCFVAMAALAVLMMGVTAVDVVLRWFGSGIPGAYEIVTLGMRVLIPLALPYVFWIGGHIAVDMLVDRLRPRLRRAIARAGIGLSAAVMGYLTYAVTMRALTVADSGELTSDLQLPQVYYWIPLIVGAALSTPVALYLAFRDPPSRNESPLRH
jgi:TRAP-type C4-dicarboxylate transport system permease small subunit